MFFGYPMDLFDKLGSAQRDLRTVLQTYEKSSESFLATREHAKNYFFKYFLMGFQ
jgi:hypothetical protein